MSPNPSHALLNQDVVYVIFQHLAVPDASWYEYDTATCSTKSVDDTTERRGTLARCARVCRALLFPAVSVLWRNLDSLETLGVLAQSSTPQKAEVAVSVGLSWLPTYAQYSYWVRAVHNPSTSLAQSSHLSPLNDGPYLPTLPRLTRLRWVQEVPGTTDLLPLLSPVLRSLHILFRNSRNTRPYEHQTFVGALLLQAAERVPNLRYLRITRASGIPEAWLLHVDQFARVEVLDISEPTYDEVTTRDLLPRLAAMGSLRSLKLRLPAATIYGVHDPATRSFGALQDLHLDCKHASLDDAIALLRLVSSPYLESVRLEECECPTDSLSGSLLELCTVLHASFGPTLRTISLSMTPIGAPVVFEHPLIKHLEPLFHIRELTEFCFRTALASKNVSILVLELDLAAIAESWPRLRRLDLNYVAVAERPGLRTLLSFARHCPSLTSLNLPCIDALDVEFLSPGPPHLSLTYCSVSDCGWDSLIPDPKGLARFLKALFPNLTLFRPRLRIVSEHWVRTVEYLDGLH